MWPLRIVCFSKNFIRFEKFSLLFNNFIHFRKSECKKYYIIHTKREKVEFVNFELEKSTVHTLCTSQRQQQQNLRMRIHALYPIAPEVNTTGSLTIGHAWRRLRLFHVESCEVIISHEHLWKVEEYRVGVRLVPSSARFKHAILKSHSRP